MSIRLEKPWRELEVAEVARLGCELGVFQLGDQQGRVIRIGFAGGRSLFGLRGELANELARRAGQKVRFRLEITSQYLSRFEELLMIHKADHGELPPENESDRDRRIGRLHPS
jgi:hypothetical protein